MEITQQSKPQCFGYPPAVEAPSIPYHRNPDSNPVLRGIFLVIGAWLVSKFEFLQKFLWENAGFDSLRTLADLKNYSERWDPTVSIPPLKDQTLSSKIDYRASPLPEYVYGHSYTITEYHSFYTSGRLTPLDVAEYILSIIRRDIVPVSRHASAFISSNPDAILSAARDSTLRYKSKSPISIFDGVPTAIKDEYHVAGYRTTMGRKPDSALFLIASESSWPVYKLEEAGAMILGKLNMHELGADTTNNNPNYGTPLNPYNSLYYTGGSSGGAGYAVSTGIIPFALGTDGGGSIRLPASFCGVYGLKPSHGRLGDTGSTVTVMGPIASTISDLEIVYRYLSELEGSNNHFNSVSSSTIFKPKLIGICKLWFERADVVVKNLCLSAVKHYETKLGYKVVEITLPCLSHGQTAHAITILAEMSLRARRNAKNSDWLSGLNAANKILLTVGAQTSLKDYSLAQQLRNLLMQHLSYLYKKYPGLLIVTPTCPMPGWPIDQEIDLKYGISDGSRSMRCIEYVWLANFCGNPAITCPVGYADPIKGQGRIPVGIMAIGEWGSEEQLLKWGKECEKFLHNEGGGRIKPENWTDVVRETEDYTGLAMENIEKS